MLPALPGSSSARRRMASRGTPAALSSVLVCSVIRLLLVPKPKLASLARYAQPYARHLPALRVEREHREARLPRWLGRAGEPGYRRADDGRLHDVVAPALLERAFPLAHPHVHVVDHDAFGTQPPHVPLRLDPRVVPGVVDELGVPDHLGVACAPPRLPDRQPVVVPRRHRDAEDEAGRRPALHDQLGEVLARQVGGERLPQARAARRAHRGADGLELQPPGGEGPDGQPDADDAVPAEFRALLAHPADGGVPRVVHRLHERGERPHTAGAAAGHLSDAPVGPEWAVPRPRARAPVPARVPDVVNGSAEYLADGLEADAADRGELVGGQRRTPRAAAPDL